MSARMPRQNLISLLSGLLFGAGLAIAEMTNPAKVQNFLDIAGNWDLSLIFVMASGIGVMMLAYAVAKKRTKPIYADSFQLPTRTDLPPRLFIGSTLFGIGWGLTGLCPGPALTGLLQFQLEFYVFFISMMIAMKLYSLTSFASSS